MPVINLALAVGAANGEGSSASGGDLLDET